MNGLLQLPRAIPLELPRAIPLELPRETTLEYLYQISDQNIWFLMWILKKIRFWSDLAREVLEAPFIVHREYHDNGQKKLLYISKNEPTAKLPDIMGIFFRMPAENVSIEYNEKRHGCYTKWDSGGELITKSYWKNGKHHGEEHIWQNGNKIAYHNWKNGKPNGLCREWNSLNGHIFEIAGFKDGKYEGIHQRWHTNGHQFTNECWSNDIPRGIHCTRNQQGKIIDQVFYGIEYVPYNAILQTATVFGKDHSGNLREKINLLKIGNYYYRDGNTYKWYANNQKRSESYWVKDVKMTEKSWYENGQLRSDFTLINGFWIGFHRVPQLVQNNVEYVIRPGSYRLEWPLS